jgi:hypothetical protein
VAPLPQATTLIYRHNHLEPGLHVAYQAEPDARGRRAHFLSWVAPVKYSPISCRNRLVPMKQGLCRIRHKWILFANIIIS